MAVLLAADPDARRRNPSEAVHLAKRARDLTDGRDPGALEVMALAYAAAGRFEDAASTEAEVVEMARTTGNAELESEASGAVQTYRNHQSPQPLMGR